MISNNATLPSWPNAGLFGRPVAPSSIRYMMPRSRYFVAGLALSVAVHAGGILGFNHRGVRIELPPDTTYIKIIEEIERAARAVQLDLSSAPETTKPTSPARSENPGVRAATLAEPLRPMRLDGEQIAIDKLTPAIPPKFGGPDIGIPTTTEREADGLKGSEEVLRSIAVDVLPVARSQAAPRYPFNEKQAGRNGVVVVRFVVTRDGAVDRAEVISATSAEFARAAVEAVAKWTFSAGRKNGRRVNTELEVPVIFTLSGAA